MPAITTCNVVSKLTPTNRKFVEHLDLRPALLRYSGSVPAPPGASHTSRSVPHLPERFYTSEEPLYLSERPYTSRKVLSPCKTFVLLSDRPYTSQIVYFPYESSLCLSDRFFGVRIVPLFPRSSFYFPDFQIHLGLGRKDLFSQLKSDS